VYSSAKWGVHTYGKYAKYAHVTILPMENGFTYYFSCPAFYFAYFTADSADLFAYSAYENALRVYFLYYFAYNFAYFANFIAYFAIYLAFYSYYANHPAYNIAYSSTFCI
jgi:hypothetical protein